MLKNRYTLTIIIGVIILISLIIINNIRSRQEPKDDHKQNINKNSFKNISAAPTLAVSGVSGIDVNSQVVKKSIDEISIINNKLPYKSTVKLDSGEEAIVYIPKTSQNAHRWLLTVNIDGVDYEIPDKSPDMSKHRELFRMGAQNVYGWLRDQGVDPENIMILWGDTKKIQDRSLEWLQ